MTDQSQPDRQDGDGLLPCPFCGPGNSMVDSWFDDVSKRWAVGCGRCGASCGRSVHAEGSKKAAIKSWNTRGLTPTRDAAEGALLTRSICNTGDVRKQEIVEIFVASLIERGVRVDAAWITEAGSQVQSAADLLFHGSLTTVDEQIAGHGDLVCKFAGELIIAEVLDHGLELVSLNGDLNAEAKTVQKGSASISTKYAALSPSGAGAAEPVARCPVCDWPMASDQSKGCVSGDCCYRPDDPAEQERIRKRRADLVTPPVRGDREIIQRAYDALVFYACMDNHNVKSDRLADDSDGSPRYKMHASPIQKDDGDCARQILPELRAILSLPVQPTVFPNRNAFYTILNKYIPQQSIDSAWQELREAGLIP